MGSGPGGVCDLLAGEAPREDAGLGGVRDLLRGEPAPGTHTCPSSVSNGCDGGRTVPAFAHAEGAPLETRTRACPTATAAVVTEGTSGFEIPCVLAYSA